MIQNDAFKMMCDYDIDGRHSEETEPGSNRIDDDDFNLATPHICICPVSVYIQIFI